MANEEAIPARFGRHSAVDDMLPVCPACLAACSSKPRWTFTAGEAAQHFVLAEEFPDVQAKLQLKIAALWKSQTCDIHTCGSCHLTFAWPFVAGDGEFYNLAYPYSGYPKDRWEFDETVGALSTNPLAAGDLAMEIGSGFGHFLTRIAPRFIAAERVIAVDYNETARARLTESGFAAIGEDVRSGVFDRYRNQLGAIFMFQVLEHMDDLDNLMGRLRQLSRTGAALYISVPNSLRIDFNETHGALHDMPPNHISRWSKEAFGALAQRSGLELVEHRIEPVSAAAFIRQDIVFSHMRRAQVSGSLANRVRGRRRTRGRLAAEALVALLSVPGRLPAWATAAAQRSSLGNTVWVRLRFQ